MAINYPTSLDTFTDKTDNVDNVQAVDMNDVQDAVEALEAKVGIDSSADTSSLDYKVNNFFATGRTLLLYEDSAPTGWTIQNTLDDKLVFVTKGSAAGGQTGGTVHSSGTWTQPNHSHSHSHKWYDYVSGANHKDGAGNNISVNTENSGSTGITGAGGAATYVNLDLYTDTDTTGSATANTWRPAAYCCIMVKKD